MGYLGKIFGSIPYKIRENDTPIYKESELEKYLIKYFGSKEESLKEIISIFHDDKHEGNIVNIETKNTKDEIWYGDEHYNICLRITAKFSKRRDIGSHDLEAKLVELNEMELHTAFKAMVGCDGKKIFVAISEDAFDYFSKDSKYYKFKKLLIERKEFVNEFASAFGLDTEPLYKEIENIIKNTCKELGLTYAQLGEQIGYGEGALKVAVSNNKVSEPMKKAIELYLKTIELEEKLANSEKIKETLKEWLK